MFEDVADAPADDSGTPPADDGGSAVPESPSAGRDDSPNADDDQGTPPAAAAPAEGKAAVGSEKWRKFLESRGIQTFDETAQEQIADLIHKGLGQGKRNAELEAKLAELEQERQRRPAEPEVPPEPPADIKEIDGQITALKDKIESSTKRQADLLTQFGVLDRKIVAAEAAVKYADELDKPQRQAELVQLQQAAAGVARAWEAEPDRRLLFERELKRTERERADAERLHGESERARQEAESRTKTFMAEFPATVDGLVTRFADELKAPGDSAFRQRLNARVCDSLTVAFWRLKDAGINTVDVGKLVRDHVQQYLTDHGLVEKVRLNQVSQGKQQVGRPVTVSRSPVPNVTTSKLSMDEQLAIEKSERLKRMARLKL
jgi:hypothetical protein